MNLRTNEVKLILDNILGNEANIKEESKIKDLSERNDSDEEDYVDSSYIVPKEREVLKRHEIYVEELFMSESHHLNL
jgi:hypothetical protein